MVTGQTKNVRRKFKMTKVKVSPKNSFIGWEFYEFIKGRKKSLITGVVTLLSFWIADSALVAVIAGLVIESGLGILEYYLKKKRLDGFKNGS